MHPTQHSILPSTYKACQQMFVCNTICINTLEQAQSDCRYRVHTLHT